MDIAEQRGWLGVLTAHRRGSKKRSRQSTTDGHD
jgi:hypothetical protein